MNRKKYILVQFSLTTFACLIGEVACLDNHSDDKVAYPALAEAIKKIAGEGSSLEQIKSRTGLSRTTAKQLRAGIPVTPNTIERFARGYRVPTNPLLIAMGKEPLHHDPTADLSSMSEQDDDSTSEIINFRDGRVVKITGISSRKDRKLMRSLIERLMEKE